MPTKLFIGNISDSCTEDDLKQHFESHGKVVEFAIIRNYGFVHFEQQEEAEKAMKALHNSTLKGTMIRVEISKTPFKTGAGRVRYPDSGSRGRGGRPGYGQDRGRGGHHPSSRYHPYDRYAREPPPSSWSDQRYGYDSRREDYSRSYDQRSGDSRGYSDGRYSDYYSRQRYGDPVRYPDSSNRY